jgi:hypothetical protein
MEQKIVAHVDEVCLVPYRLSSTGVEFCLISSIGENRWEFPKVGLEDQSASVSELLSQTAVANGIWGSIRSDEPLGDFHATRGAQSRTMTGFLMRVSACEDVWPRQTSHRRLWCLPEEARARIRRKPLRRFIDLALRQAESASEQAVASAPSAHARAG